MYPNNSSSFTMENKVFMRTAHLGSMNENSNDFIRISDIKKGDKFYECHHTWGNMELVAITDAQLLNDKWTCKVRDRNDNEYDIFVSANTSHYGPDLFEYPQIIDQNDSGEYGYYID